MPIPSDPWLLISPYLREALALDKEELATWLSSLRAVTPAIADPLEPLLLEYRKVARRRLFAASAVYFSQQSGLAGQVICGSRLITPIGVGGMGSVQLAEGFE